MFMPGNHIQKNTVEKKKKQEERANEKIIIQNLLLFSFKWTI